MLVMAFCIEYFWPLNLLKIYLFLGQIDLMKIYQFIEYNVVERVGIITLNRPEKENALNDVMIIELRDAIIGAENDPMVKVLLINGKGKHFCVGYETEYLEKVRMYNLEQNMADATSLAQLYFAIYRSTKVVIAQVQGKALAEGAGLVSVCDFAYAGNDLEIGFTEVTEGFIPALAITFLLRKIGETRTKEMILSGKTIDAETAERYDLVNHIVDNSQLNQTVKEFTKHLCEKTSAASLQLLKKMVADIHDFPLENGVKFAGRMSAYARVSDASRRGIDARLDGKEINW